MTKNEINKRIEAGETLKKWFGIKNMHHYIGADRITQKQFDAALTHFGDRLEFKLDAGGYTTHRYNIKQVKTDQ